MAAYGRFLEPPLLNFEHSSDRNNEGSDNDEVYADRWSPRGTSIFSRALSPNLSRILLSPFRKISRNSSVFENSAESDDNDGDTDGSGFCDGQRKISFWERLTPDFDGGSMLFAKSARRYLPRRLLRWVRDL